MSRAGAAVERAVGGGLEIPSDRAPSAEARRLLDDRRLCLVAALSSAETVAIRRRVAKLFGMFAPGAMDAETSEGLVEDYTRLLASQPLWAIDRACIAALHSGGTFRPSAPELLRLAADACDAERRELADLRRVLSAKIYHVATPEMRARVRAGFDRLKKGFEPESRPVSRDERRVMAELRAMDIGAMSAKSPLTVSPSARAALGFPPLPAAPFVDPEDVAALAEGGA